MTENNIWHVTPIDDLEVHQQETFWKGDTLKSICSCSPYIEHGDKGIVVIHNSFDGRELFEWNNKVREN